MFTCLFISFYNYVKYKQIAQTCAAHKVEAVYVESGLRCFVGQCVMTYKPLFQSVLTVLKCAVTVDTIQTTVMNQST